MSDHIPTLADICSAIAEGHIPVAVEGSMYQVNALELRRYLNRFRSLPTLNSQDPSLCSSSDGWSVIVRTSVA